MNNILEEVVRRKETAYFIFRQLRYFGDHENGWLVDYNIDVQQASSSLVITLKLQHSE